MIQNFENAIKFAEKKSSKCKTFDNRLAIFRLLSTVVLLAILVALAPGKGFVYIFLLSCLFLFYCLFTSFIHKKFQKIERLWTSLAKSYRLSKSRVERKISILQENISPWHDKIAVVPEGHAYASDIDLKNELFLLMNTCSTEGGSHKLFQSLLTAGKTPCDKVIVEKRIQIASQLTRYKSLLRRFEALRLSEDFIKNYYRYSSESEIEQKNNWQTLSYAFISIGAWFFLLFPLFFKEKNINVFLQPLFIYAIFILIGTFIFQPLVSQAMLVSKSTNYIQLIIKCLKLNSKKQALTTGENWIESFLFLQRREVKKIGYMNFFLDILSLRGNPVFWILIHIFLPFDAIFSLFLYFVVKKIKSNISAWQNEIDEFDLIASFARLKVENPEFRFFSLPSESRFCGNDSCQDNIKVSNMGHPLISRGKRVCNSLQLAKESPLVLLTGSNMSGKSTFLRAFATNILLANMGAPVCAEKFSLPSMRILCAIRVDDSLSEGTSYFYAEVKRLAEILRQLKTSVEPTMFFIDEIFKGTNNKERYLGSLSILKAFLEMNAFGFVSTHDLALTELAQQETGLRNMHFREHIEDNKLTFDYTLKEGPCPTTNALFIMKMAGLPIS